MNSNIIISIILFIIIILLLLINPKELFYQTTSKASLGPFKLDEDVRIHDEWFKEKHFIIKYKETEREILDLSNEITNYLMGKTIHSNITNNIESFYKGRFVDYNDNLYKLLNNLLGELINMEIYIKKKHNCDKLCLKIIHTFIKYIDLNKLYIGHKLIDNNKSYIVIKQDIIKNMKLKNPNSKTIEPFLSNKKKLINPNLQNIIPITLPYSSKPRMIVIDSKKLNANVNIYPLLDYYKDKNSNYANYDLEKYIGQHIIKESYENYKINIEKIYDYIINQEPHKLRVVIFLIFKKLILENLKPEDNNITIARLPCIYYDKNTCKSHSYCKVNTNNKDYYNVDCVPKKSENKNNPIEQCESISKYGKTYCELNHQRGLDGSKINCKYINNTCYPGNKPAPTNSVNILAKCLKKSKETCENNITKCATMFDTPIYDNIGECKYSNVHNLCIPKDHKEEDVKCHYFDDSRYKNYNESKTQTLPIGQTSSTNIMPVNNKLKDPNEIVKIFNNNPYNDLVYKEELCNRVKDENLKNKCQFIKHYVKSTHDNPKKNKYFSKCMTMDINDSKTLPPEYIQFDTHNGLDFKDTKDYSAYIAEYKDKPCKNIGGTWVNKRCIKNSNNCESIINNIDCKKNTKCGWEETSPINGFCYNKLLKSGVVDNYKLDKNNFVANLFFDESKSNYKKQKLLDKLSKELRDKIKLAIDVKARKTL